MNEDNNTQDTEALNTYIVRLVVPANAEDDFRTWLNNAPVDFHANRLVDGFGQAGNQTAGIQESGISGDTAQAA